MGPCNVYGADGDVTGDAVVRQYGMPDYYNELAPGVDFKGRSAITRTWRVARNLNPNWRNARSQSAASSTRPAKRRLRSRRRSPEGRMAFRREGVHGVVLQT